MEYKWLNKSDNKNIIVFFNGWGMSEKSISHLDCSNYDVLTFYDYRSFEIPNIDFSKYEKKYLIAWSMGVYVSNFFYEIFKSFDKFIAINGTQIPINNTYGIPESIYDLTIKNFNELSCSKFLKKIAPSINLREICTRNTDELKSELISIKNLKVKNYYKYDEAYISLKDRIIPPINQKNFWELKNIKYIESDNAHYIFDKFNSWSDLLCLVNH